MNSIQIDIGGKDREITFGLWTLGEILGHFDTDVVGFGSLLSKNPFKAIPAVLYYGHLYAVKKAKKAPDFDLMDVNEWIEDLDKGYANKQIDDTLQVLLDAMKKHVPGLAEVEEAGAKKK